MSAKPSSQTLKEFPIPPWVKTILDSEAQRAPTPPRAPADAPHTPGPLLQGLSSEDQSHAVGARGELGMIDAPSLKPPLQRADPASNLFRQQAVLAYERGEKLPAVLKLTAPTTWGFFIVMLVGAFAALAVSVFCKIDVTGRGRGILRSLGGAQTLSAAIGGTVQQLHVHSGDKVVAGQLVLTLDSTALRADLVQAKRQLEFVQKRLQELNDNRELHERSLQLLRTDARLQQRRLRSETDSLQTLSERRSAYSSLGQRGFVARAGVDEISEQLRGVERGRLALEQGLAHTRLQEVELERERREQLQRARSDLEAAQGRLSALETMLAQTSVRAPAEGRIEGLDARAGDQVQVGQPIATLVPLARPTQVVVFAEDRDRAFLRVGSMARLEIDQLPVAEFGVLTGRISAIGAHFASAREQQLTLGDSAVPDKPCYRVEVELAQTDRNQRLLDRLSSGALVTARFSLRERRLITLILAPLHELLDQKD
ncbi:MAG TPA: HlyD family efflux transporter periplasmic adaptor subunit [Polyangiales bacterium]|nr:HlyD family efflux transporter periplasmic adaptor subunit [Polyangiales bacterium]